MTESPDEISIFGSGLKCSELACIMANYFGKVMVNPILSGKKPPFGNDDSIEKVNEFFEPNLLFLNDYQERIVIAPQTDQPADWLIAVSPDALSFIVNELKPGPDTVLFYFHPGAHQKPTHNNPWSSCQLNFYYIGNWRRQNLIELFPADGFPERKLKTVTNFIIERAGKKAIRLENESLSQKILTTLLQTIKSFCIGNSILPTQLEPLTGKIIGGPSKGIFNHLGLKPQLIGDDLVMNATRSPESNNKSIIKIKTSAKTNKIKKVIRKARTIKSLDQRIYFFKRQSSFISEFYQQYFTNQLALINELSEHKAGLQQWINLIYQENFGYQADLADWLPPAKQYFDEGQFSPPGKNNKLRLSRDILYDEGNRTIDLKKLNGNIIWQNEESHLYDLGDGILNFAFQSRLNILGPLVMEGLEKAYEIAETRYKCLIIGNQGTNFSVGANLGIIFLHVLDRDYRSLEEMIRRFQHLIQRARYSKVPVVVAPHSMALGGAVELSLHADLVHPAMETYAGLVESNVGLIPGGGGTTALTIKSWQEISANGNYEFLRQSFASMLLGRLSGSALEAISFNYFPKDSPVSHSLVRHLFEAKNSAVQLVLQGYQQPVQKRVEVDQAGIRLLGQELEVLTKKHKLSTYQVEIGEMLIRIMTGDGKNELSEPDLLELECETFLHLLGRKKTLERIWSLFTKGSPVKN